MDSPAFPSPTEHDGVICDICEVSPIVGIRYKSKRVFDYDLCEVCFQTHASTKENDYVALRMPQYESLDDLVQALRDNDANVEEAYLYIYGMSESIEQYRALQSAIADATALKSLWLHMVHVPSTSSVVCLSHGIMENKSIQLLSWAIPKACRVQAITEVKAALCEMIRHNNVLQTLDFWCPYIKKSVEPAVDELALAILKGMEYNNSLQILHLEPLNVVSNSLIRNRVVNLLKNNTTLKQLHMQFESDDVYQLDILFGESDDARTAPIADDEDYRVCILLAKNRGQWLTRLATDNVSKHDRMALVFEALEAVPVNASVHTLYYLLQHKPQLLNDLRPLLL